ncbi:MAG: porin family protein [Vicinamibacterales bacterium]
MRNMLAAALVIVVSAMPAVVQAQSFELGVKGGVVFATLTGGPEEFSEGTYERFSYDASIALGGAFAFRIGDRVAFQPEVLFVQKTYELHLRGGQWDDPLPLNIDGRVRQNYLELPMLLRVAMGAGGIQALAGPSVNVSLDCWDCGPAVDVGIAIGAGFYGETFTMEGRYEEGLREIYRLLGGESHRNRAILVLFGVRRR